MDDIKKLTSQICTLCEQKWPDEFHGKYTSSREDFRDWLNEKTNLSVDHIINKETALEAWAQALEAMQ